jgi:hypothetical protein
MSPEQKIKREILLIAVMEDDIDWNQDDDIMDIDGDEIDDAYEDILVDKQLHWEFEHDFRDSGEATDLPTNYSRHYECYEMARKMCDGTWVGWTYWYGGGKHGEPGDISWMEDAYEVSVTEEERLVVVKTFEKIE